MVELCVSLFDTGLAEHKRRETELNSFFSGQKDTKTYYQQEASQILEKFDQQHIEANMGDHYILNKTCSSCPAVKI